MDALIVCVSELSSVLVIVRLDGLDCAVSSDVQFCELNASLVRAAAGSHCIVIEEIPFAIDLNDGVVCCPADDGLHYPALVCVKGPSGESPSA